MEAVVVRVGQYPSIGALSCVVGFKVLFGDPFPTLVGVESTEKFAGFNPHITVQGRHDLPYFYALGIPAEGMSIIVECGNIKGSCAVRTLSIKLNRRA